MPPIAATLFFIFLISSPSLPLPPTTTTTTTKKNITLLGDASIDDNQVITLTQQLNPTGFGRAFHRYPVPFLDAKTNAPVSFSTHFSFSITPSPSLPFGDGLAFFIASDPLQFSTSQGYLGLPNTTADLGYSITPQQEPSSSSFIAVEFDTSFDPSLGDINDNHLGVDVGTIVSFHSVDVGSMGIDLKSGRPMKAWIEYLDHQKMMRVWMDYSAIKPPSPVLATQIDLSDKLREVMYVGFSASNGRGAARHLVLRWKFRTFGFNHSKDEADREEDEQADREEQEQEFQYGCFACTPDELKPEKGGKNLIELVLALGGGAAVLFLMILILTGTTIYLLRKQKQNRNSRDSEAALEKCREEIENLPREFSFSQLKYATRGFHRSRIIGEGASATVYNGVFASGHEVAVKKFSLNTSITKDPFTAELSAVMNTLRHKNLVQLQGWCSEGRELILVYEYLSLGSLDNILHNNSSNNSRTPTIVLTWEQRENIILGVASALAYLHGECERQIIHRDVKSSNIMLDSELNAKLGDYSLAELRNRISPTPGGSISIPVGTMGYLAPEYVHQGRATEKTDVYSFGVVVLEVVTGRRAIDVDGNVLVDWVWRLWGEGRVVACADCRLERRFDDREVEKMVMIGLWCVHPKCDRRPTMREAISMLRGEVLVPILPGRKPVARFTLQLPESAHEFMRDAGGEPTRTKDYANSRSTRPNRAVKVNKLPILHLK
ncbi:hypothetical protein Scep_002294 [Stephania cephalantha]|uniref:non-specific serine/threonine protein kinase n=1 Tax=Stephania cephalantha TaxID=152367 RepID=A0AAP0LAY2_9MAGN